MPKSKIKTNKAGVLWSGGLDSTYLIYYYLSTFQHVSVVAHYIELMNNTTKTRMELNACKKLAEVFNVMFPNRFEWHYGTSVNISYGTGEVTFKQLPSWLLGALFLTKTDTVAMGYVMNDDAISFLDDIQRVWKSMQFMRHDRAILEFPLVKVKKDEIVSQLPGELKQHVVWCEMPNQISDTQFEPCGQCHPCQRSPLIAKAKMHDGVAEKLAEKCPVCQSIVAKECVNDGDGSINPLRQRYLVTPER